MKKHHHKLIKPALVVAGVLLAPFLFFFLTLTNLAAALETEHPHQFTDEKLLNIRLGTPINEVKEQIGEPYNIVYNSTGSGCASYSKPRNLIRIRPFQLARRVVWICFDANHKYVRTTDFVTAI